MKRHPFHLAAQEPEPTAAGAEPETATCNTEPALQDASAEAPQYRRQRVRLYLLEQLLDLFYLAAVSWLLVYGLDVRPPQGFWARSWQLAAVTAAVLLGNWVVSFPLNYWRGYVLEHRYGLSRLRLTGWLWRQAKVLALGLAFSTAVFTGLFWCIWWAGPWWFLVAAGAFLLVNVVLGQVVPVVVLPLFYRVEPLQDEELLRRFQPLLRRAGLHLQGIFRVALGAETVKANAALTGLGRTRRVLLSDTLLELLGPEELEVIVAHELGHHVHRHLLKLMLLGTLAALVGFWLCDLAVFHLWPGLPGGDYRLAGPMHVPVLLLATGVLSFLGQPVGNAVSRYFERQADCYAVQQTGRAEAFARAMTRLARLNKTDPNPPRLEVWWLHSHPPVAERIRLARQVAQAASESEPPPPD